jgi:hypothetical protein
MSKARPKGREREFGFDAAGAQRIFASDPATAVTRTSRETRSS